MPTGHPPLQPRRHCTFAEPMPFAADTPPARCTATILAAHARALGLAPGDTCCGCAARPILPPSRCLRRGSCRFARMVAPSQGSRFKVASAPFPSPAGFGSAPLARRGPGFVQSHTTTRRRTE